jgi:hypothetical protein
LLNRESVFDGVFVDWHRLARERFGELSVESAVKAEVETLKTNEEKWSKELMAAGWTVLPSMILEKQHALGLDAIDINIIAHLSIYWWKKANLPHPSVATIAKAVGLNPEPSRSISRRWRRAASLPATNGGRQVRAARPTCIPSRD